MRTVVFLATAMLPLSACSDGAPHSSAVAVKLQFALTVIQFTAYSHQ